MSMENIIKRLNFIVFLKLFRTEKSVKKRRTMGGIYHYEMECQSRLNNQLFSILLSRQIENVNILVRFSIRQQGNKIKAI